MYQDKMLTCKDCGQSFTFTAGEQEFYASRGFENEPTRCKTCRESKKGGRHGSSGGRSMRSSEREMFSAVCAGCGREAQVPFRPTQDRPVYCKDCFSRRGA
jgi:CxxC-x17-CxxC domain-containing protein